MVLFVPSFEATLTWVLLAVFRLMLRIALLGWWIRFPRSSLVMVAIGSDVMLPCVRVAMISTVDRFVSIKELAGTR